MPIASSATAPQHARRCVPPGRGHQELPHAPAQADHPFAPLTNCSSDMDEAIKKAQASGVSCRRESRLSSRSLTSRASGWARAAVRDQHPRCAGQTGKRPAGPCPPPSCPRATAPPARAAPPTLPLLAPLVCGCAGRGQAGPRGGGQQGQAGGGRQGGEPSKPEGEAPRRRRRCRRRPATGGTTAGPHTCLASFTAGGRGEGGPEGLGSPRGRAGPQEQTQCR